MPIPDNSIWHSESLYFSRRVVRKRHDPNHQPGPPPFPVKPASFPPSLKSPECSVEADGPVTGDDDGERVAGQGGADGPGSPRVTQMPGDPLIRAHPSPGNSICLAESPGRGSRTRRIFGSPWWTDHRMATGPNRVPRRHCKACVVSVIFMSLNGFIFVFIISYP